MAKDASGLQFQFGMELPRNIFYDSGISFLTLRVGSPVVSEELTHVALPKQRHVNAERMLAPEPTSSPGLAERKPFGIILYSHLRIDGALAVLGSLKKQGALS